MALGGGFAWRGAQHTWVMSSRWLGSARLQAVTVEDYSEKNTEWPTAIMSAGGDGTFLLASSCINTTRTPLIGACQIHLRIPVTGACHIHLRCH
jgi:NAD kinase